MSKLGKIVVKTCVALIFLTIFSAVAHYLLFPQETNSLLINFSNFQNYGRIYTNFTTPKAKIDSLQSLINQASVRIDSFWGEQTCDPKFIYCNNDEDYKRYAVNPSAPAVTYLKLGAVIVLSASAADLDIIAHELSHAELYKRVGFFKFNYKIPAWFKHGLAMQNDYRNYYSEDTLKAKTDNFVNMPDVRRDTTDALFYRGTREQVMLNYMAAKHEVAKWYTRQRLSRFINDLNSGKAFEETFRR